MYIESALPCGEYFTVSTGALLREIREMKAEKRDAVAEGFV